MILESKKKELIDGFDFETVQKIMILLDRKIYMPDKFRIISVEEIKKKVSELYDELVFSKDIEKISSYGFSVYYENECSERDVINLELLLLLEQFGRVVILWIGHLFQVGKILLLSLLCHLFFSAV